jgi:hypothetical protein
MNNFFLTDAKGTGSAVGTQGVAILTGDPKKAILLPIRADDHHNAPDVQ